MGVGSGDRLRVSLVIPTYGRPEMLARALLGIAAQRRQFDQVVVVRRVTDAESAEVLVNSPVPLTEVTVSEPGVLAALRSGAAAADGDVIAFTDDDAVPRPEWLSTLLEHYAD